MSRNELREITGHQAWNGVRFMDDLTECEELKGERSSGPKAGRIKPAESTKPLCLCVPWPPSEEP